MDRKIITMIISFISLLSITSCTQSEIDALPAGKWYFLIVNSTTHKLRIESDCHTNEGRKIVNIDILPQDSILREGVHYRKLQYGPFNSYCTHLVFDDTLYYLCESYKQELNHDEMVIDPDNYDCVLDGPDIYLYRYEITEKEYEYAKAHPYKLEEE